MSSPAPMRGLGKHKRDEHGILWGDHRCTPEPIWRAALHAAGLEAFCLDPASNPNATVQAQVHWMGPLDGNDGLEKTWFGNVWLNFPFSTPRIWVDKVEEELEHVTSVTVLGPNDSSTAWWRQISAFCDARADWPRRLHFPLPGQDKGSPPGPVGLWFVGKGSTRWRRVLSGYGCSTWPGGWIGAM